MIIVFKHLKASNGEVGDGFFSVAIGDWTRSNSFKLQEQVRWTLGWNGLVGKVPALNRGLN